MMERIGKHNVYWLSSEADMKAYWMNHGTRSKDDMRHVSVSDDTRTTANKDTPSRSTQWASNAIMWYMSTETPMRYASWFGMVSLSIPPLQAKFP